MHVTPTSSNIEQHRDRALCSGMQSTQGQSTLQGINTGTESTQGRNQHRDGINTGSTQGRNQHRDGINTGSTQGINTGTEHFASTQGQSTLQWNQHRESESTQGQNTLQWCARHPDGVVWFFQAFALAQIASIGLGDGEPGVRMAKSTSIGLSEPPSSE